MAAQDLSLIDLIPHQRQDFVVFVHCSKQISANQSEHHLATWLWRDAEEKLVKELRTQVDVMIPSRPPG